jgi:hypothetical protein
MRLSDRARFRPDDPEPLVEASFACPYCLTCSRIGTMRVWDGEPRVFCRCPTCKARWSVSLTAGQQRRLERAPPRDLGLRS